MCLFYALHGVRYLQSTGRSTTAALLCCLPSLAGVEVSLGPTNCKVQLHNDTLIVCAVSSDTPAGWRDLAVSVAGYGAPVLASGVDPTLLAETLQLGGASPSTLTEGVGIVLILEASGLDAASCRSHQVSGWCWMARIAG